MQCCLYCKEPINGHTSYLVKVEFPLKTGEIELRDIGLACDKCIIDEGKPLVMHCDDDVKKKEGSKSGFQYRCA